MKLKHRSSDHQLSQHKCMSLWNYIYRAINIGSILDFTETYYTRKINKEE